MTEDKTELKIFIEGSRASGKTVLLTVLEDYLTSLGANVMTRDDIDARMEEQNKQYIRAMNKHFERCNIKIITIPTLENEYDTGIKNLKIWGIE